MDLTYMPGELDHKNEKKNIKREHDSVDDFEHLDPDLSPVDVMSRKSVGSDNPTVPMHEGNEKKSYDEFFTGDASKDLASSQGKPEDLVSQKEVKDFMSDFDFGLQATKAQTDVDTKNDPNLLDFGVEKDFTVSEPSKESYDFNSSFITAEKEDKMSKHGDNLESDLLGLQRNKTPGLTHVQEPLVPDEDVKPFAKEADAMLSDLIGKGGDSSDEELSFNNIKSMKAADALAQYDIMPEKSDLTSLSGNNEQGYFGDSPKKEVPDQKPNVQYGFQSEIDNTDVPTQYNKQLEELSSKNDVSTENPPKEPTSSFEHSQPEKESSPVTSVPALVPVPSKTSQEAPKKPATVKKASVDLDDIIGPEDVFKRIGLDAWFTPERLHPKVEALVYWRDPKQSGIVFGSIMAILLSFCYMSLISVVAYFSLFALFGTICFRVYKTILQAIQKTNEGHPFKEYLELDLSLPQDKVREIVDTGVTHINAGIVELRRLFLVEDLIDSVKFAVCLWCLTFIGAIFNGMTLVILAFVALFTVPKIYENNKASIDQYIEVGRSKVAEITSKVKAALPIGKKEPEKDKEQ